MAAGGEKRKILTTTLSIRPKRLLCRQISNVQAPRKQPQGECETIELCQPRPQKPASASCKGTYQPVTIVLSWEGVSVS